MAGYDGGYSLVPDGGSNMLVSSGDLVAPATLAIGEHIRVENMPFSDALYIQLIDAGKYVWDAQLIAATTGDIAIGDALLLSIYVRGGNALNETGDAHATAYLQRNGGD